MGFMNKLAQKLFGKGKKGEKKDAYVEPVRRPATAAEPEISNFDHSRDKAVAYERQDMKRGIGNDTYQRGRTRSRYSRRTQGNGVELADGRFRTPWAIRCLMLMGMNPDKVPAMKAIA